MTDYETMVEVSWKLLPLKQQEWLDDALEILRGDFLKIEETFPSVIPIVVDYPYPEIGISWLGMYSQSTIPELDDVPKLTQYHIFISPTVNGLMALDILVHELVHAVVGAEDGHGDKFQVVAAAIGLDDTGPTAVAEEVLLKRLKNIQEILGPYPLVTDCLEKA